MRVRKQILKKKDSLSEERPSFFKRKTTDKPQMTQRKFFKNPGVFPKIEFGKSGDPFEKQADAVADKVTGNPTNAGSIGAKDSGSALIQPSTDKEKSAAKFEIQKQEEEETVQANFEMQKQEEEEEEAQPKFELRRQVEEEEEELQTKLEIQKQTESTTVQPVFMAKGKPMQVQAAPNNVETNTGIDESFEQKLKNAKTGGFPLSDKLREELETKMNGNFKKVRIHSNNEAISLCKSIKAQAFTSGYHIFFNKGKFQPNSSAGKHLLAHELTHVIQQKRVHNLPGKTQNKE